jgi:hypothetical protein
MTPYVTSLLTIHYLPDYLAASAGPCFHIRLSDRPAPRYPTYPAYILTPHTFAHLAHAVFTIGQRIDPTLTATFDPRCPVTIDEYRELSHRLDAAYASLAAHLRGDLGGKWPEIPPVAECPLLPKPEGLPDAWAVEHVGMPAKAHSPDDPPPIWTSGSYRGASKRAAARGVTPAKAPAKAAKAKGESNANVKGEGLF